MLGRHLETSLSGRHAPQLRQRQPPRRGPKTHPEHLLEHPGPEQLGSLALPRHHAPLAEQQHPVGQGRRCMKIVHRGDHRVPPLGQPPQRPDDGPGLGRILSTQGLVGQQQPWS
ncbi:MAG: hypothetical protein JJU33_11990 [Phycisphaerales bacterium]|nr:hypothetical protein [Phycisphaerales bacterium]